MDDKIANSVLIISEENDLPKGKPISYIGGEVELSEALRKEFLIWKLSHDEKYCWVLALKESFGSLKFMQAIKNAEEAGYKVQKKGIIEQKVLHPLYERCASEITMKSMKDDSVVVAFFETIIKDALHDSISDIHIEARSNGAKIKMRKHGEVIVYKENLSLEDAEKLCSVIYNVLAENKDVAFDPTVYQQSSISYRIKKQELKLRYQSLVVYPGGFDVVLRLLPVGRDEAYTPLEKLGYTKQQVEDLLNISSRPVGSLIIAGVTGSGKSTTLKNLIMFINEYNEYKLKIFTIEDPPEYKIPFVSQIPVVRRKNEDYTKISPFEAPITACMRADPDIIMIGEVRDRVTGELTKKAIQSGHQVLTTVHAPSAIGIIDRLVDFQVSRTILGSPDFLTGLLYQKLLPVVCESCSKSLNELLLNDEATDKDKALWERIKKIVNPDLYELNIRGNGCKHCGGMGIKGRTVCSEIIMIDLLMMQHIANGDVINLMKHWRSSSDGFIDSENMRGKTSMEHAIQKMLSGLVSPYDVESSFKPINEVYIDKCQDDFAPNTLRSNDFMREIKENGWSEL